MNSDNNGISSNSIKAFLIELLFNETVLSTGTAFFGKIGERLLLFTNRHNVTGLNNETGKCLSKTGGIPNKLRVSLPNVFINDVQTGRLEANNFHEFIIDLYWDDSFEKPGWIEHPLRKIIDVIGLVVDVDFDISNLTFDVSSFNQHWYAGSYVSVIGFSFGLSAAYYPIWISGYIATEPIIDYGGLPMFLIDSRTRPGQSGSPVVSVLRSGQTIVQDGVTLSVTGNIFELIGIYSGRINSESDLGRVWKVSVIREILLNGVQYLPYFLSFLWFT